MTAFASFLASVFGGLFSFVASYFSKKVLLGAAITAAMLAVTATFYLALKALVANIVPAVGNQWFLMGFYVFWPSNAEACIAVCVAAEVAAFIYRYQMAAIRNISSV